MENTPSHVRFLDWVLTPFFLMCFAIILLVFEPIQRIALHRSRRAHENSLVCLNKSLVSLLRAFGVRIDLTNHATLAANLPYLIVSNHQSLFDIPILHCIFAEHYPRFIAKKELARWIPSVSFNLTHGENAVIDRSNPQQALDQITKLAQAAMLRGFAIVIFPEGTRARDGKLKKFRYAGLASLLQTAPIAQIVPVTISGSWKLARFPIPFRTTLKVVVGAPIEREDGSSLKAIAEDLHFVIHSKLTALEKQNLDEEKNI